MGETGTRGGVPTPACYSSPSIEVPVRHAHVPFGTYLAVAWCRPLAANFGERRQHEVRLSPGPMALERPYPGSGRGCYRGLHIPLRIDNDWLILQEVATYAGIEVTRFGSS